MQSLPKSSGIPPVLAPIAGHPLLIASTRALGKPSCKLGIMYKSKLSNHSYTG